MKKEEGPGPVTLADMEEELPEIPGAEPICEEWQMRHNPHKIGWTFP